MKDNPIRLEILSLLNSTFCERLSPAELQVLELRWGTKTGQVIQLDQVASLLGKSRETVRDLERAAMKKLKEAK